MITHTTATSNVGTETDTHGCYVQCWNCWGALHSECKSTACQCMFAAGVDEKLVERMVQVNKVPRGF